MSLSDLGKTVVEYFSNLSFKHMRGTWTSLIWQMFSDMVCQKADNSSPLQAFQPFETCSTYFLFFLAQVWWHFLRTWQVAAVGWVSGEHWRNLPRRLDQCLVLLTFQNLKIHDDNLETYNDCIKTKVLHCSSPRSENSLSKLHSVWLRLHEGKYRKLQQLK